MVRFGIRSQFCPVVVLAIAVAVIAGMLSLGASLAVA